MSLHRQEACASSPWRVLSSLSPPPHLSHDGVSSVPSNGHVVPAQGRDEDSCIQLAPRDRHGPHCVWTKPCSLCTISCILCLVHAAWVWLPCSALSQPCDDRQSGKQHLMSLASNFSAVSTYASSTSVPDDAEAADSFTDASSLKPAGLVHA